MQHLKKPLEVDAEAAELLKQIDCLRKLFPDDTGKKKQMLFGEEGAKSMLYLSRFARNEVHDVVEKKKKDTSKYDNSTLSDKGDSENAVSVVVKTVAITAHAREKKRQYAMSLVTLAADPSKRVQLVKDGCIEMLIELSSVEGIHRFL